MDRNGREKYVAKCVAAGDTEENANNTWELMAAIDKILTDEDLPPFQAPEMHAKPVVRLARLFINRYRDMIKEGDQATAAWLRHMGVAEPVALAVEGREHWRWFHEQKVAGTPVNDG